MPEVIFNGPEGRLEGRYYPSKKVNAPLALLLHPHPQHGGTMKNKVVYNLYPVFTKHGMPVNVMMRMMQSFVFDLIMKLLEDYGCAEIA